MKENGDIRRNPLAAIDWGSTNLRATLLIGGEVSDRVESPDGIRNRDGRDFDELLAALIGHWHRAHPGLRIVMSGMIGSREGWQEIPYAMAPAGIEELASGIVPVPSRHFESVCIVPGIRWDDPATETSDVMRGEETQVAGLLSQLPSTEPATICLPGTHSKWVICREGKIERFRTFLTGEAFECLTRGSLIAGNDESRVDITSEPFLRGLEFSGSSGGLLHHLFLGRTEMLTGRLTAGELRSFISGLVIGHELREAIEFAEGSLYVIGHSSAAEATGKGLEFFGVEAARVADDVHAAGILALTLTDG